MQRLGLNQLLSQKLSPQQIQFIKLLQLSTTELESRVEEELEVNPALEEGADDHFEDSQMDEAKEANEANDEINLEDYLKHDDVGGYKMKGDSGGNEEEKSTPITFGYTLFENLQTQLSYIKLTEKETIIGNQLIGSIDQDGYLRRDLQAISNDLAFTQNVEASLDELEGILAKIQNFEPAGVGARNLRECLLLQIKYKQEESETREFAQSILDKYFEEFTKKHYTRILQRTNKSEEALKDAVEMITKLNPKPGGSSNATATTNIQYLVPDFILTNENGEMVVNLNARNAPELRMSSSYSEMFDAYAKGDKKDKELKKTVSFVKQKLDSAKWFIDAIRQRQLTLLNTMRTIVEIQRNYFEDGDETNLRPMILKDVADKIEMDISTVSRVVSSKAVQTEFGIYPLKYFFSEGIATESGEEVSSREVKSVLKEIIEGENKVKPLSDEKIVAIINEKGYNLARRTVAKYREQLNIPVARLRKQL